MASQNGQQEEIHLRDYYEVVRRRWRIVVLVWGAIFFIGAGYTFWQTPMYQAHAIVQVEETQGQLEWLSDLSKLSGPLAVATEMELIKSRTLAEEVVSDLGIDAVPRNGNPNVRVKVRDFKYPTDDPDLELIFQVRLLGVENYEVSGPRGEEFGKGRLGEFFSKSGLSWVLEVTGGKPGETVIFQKIPFDSAVDSLRSRTSVAEVARQTNIIRISVEDPSPSLARDIVNKLTDLYLARNIARRSQEASQMLVFIEQQLEVTKVNLEKGEQDLGQFKSDEGLFVLSDQAGQLIRQLSGLETRKADLELQQRHMEQVLNALATAETSNAPYLLGNVSLPDMLTTQMVAELSRQLVELRGLRQEFTDQNPRVRMVSAQVEEIKEKIVNSVRNAQNSIESRLATINDIIDGYEKRLRELPRAERQLASLTRRASVNAELYTFLLKKHEEARISRAAIVGNLRIVDSAISPKKPVSPQKQRNILLVFLGGLLAGVGLAFFLEYIDDSIKDLEDASYHLGLNTYGVIPYVEHPPDGPMSLAEIDPRAPVQEAFRSLRTNIQFSASERPVKTILCTSALPGEGKTTITGNLSISLAQGGAKVLVIDCDLRRPKLHDFFRTSVEPGITNLIMRGSSWDEVVGSSLAPNLTLITAGVIPPNPAEILQSERFQAFLHEAKGKFDYILFDVPPVVAFTDAAIVASYADAVFVVVELRRSRVPAARRALELLTKVNAPVVGAILNQVRTQSHGYGYYGYYDYYSRADRSEMNSSASAWAKVKKWLT